MNSFKDKVAVVTGGTGGIGEAIVVALAEQGCHVVAFDINEDSIAQACARWQSFSTAVTARKVDVTDYDEVHKAIHDIEAEHGRLDYLVNVAGGRGKTKGSSIARSSAEDWKHVVSLNLDGPFNCIKASAEVMRRHGGGAIVTIGSLAGLTMPMSGSASYTASKSGIMGLNRHAAFELARDNIRVNAVLPGPVMTPQLEARATPEMLDSVSRTVPLGRWLRAEEIAKPVLFFLSDAASGCIGTHVVVDGGLHIGNPTTPDEYFRIRGE